MLAYHAPDVELDQAKGHARFARLMRAGPWAYKQHPNGGTLAYWQRADPTPPRLEEFGTPRPTADGLTYYPPKVLPTVIHGNAASDRPECVSVLLECGITVKIMPAYLAPRRIRSDGSIGDPVTEYGRAAFRVSDRMAEIQAKNPDQGADLLDPVVQALCREALRATYPKLTDELIDDLGLISTGDVDNLVEAAWHSPKAPADGA